LEYFNFEPSTEKRQQTRHQALSGRRFVGTAGLLISQRVH
jgi:hypothetical protein